MIKIKNYCVYFTDWFDLKQREKKNGVSVMGGNSEKKCFKRVKDKKGIIEKKIK